MRVSTRATSSLSSGLEVTSCTSTQPVRLLSFVTMLRLEAAVVVAVVAVAAAAAVAAAVVAVVVAVVAAAADEAGAARAAGVRVRACASSKARVCTQEGYDTGWA